MLFIAPAFLTLSFSRASVNGPGLQTSLNVLPRPEAGERRQVVSSGRCQRLLRICVWGSEAVFVFFENQQPVTQDAEFREGLAHFRFDGPQVFADDHGLVANAFKRKNPHQIFRPVLHIGALRGIGTFGYPI